MLNIELQTITNCNTLYYTYPLLYYKKHIQLTYNHTTIKVETKQCIKQSNNIKLHKLQIVRHDSILTDYYIIKDAFR